MATLKLNYKTITCLNYVKPSTRHGENPYISQEEQICKTFQDKIKTNLSYRHSTLSKLNDEYMCSPTYVYKPAPSPRYDEPSHQKPMPNCDQVVYKVFSSKFIEAQSSLSRALTYASSSIVDLSALSVKVIEAKKAADDLKDYIDMNQSAIRAAFEIALYDTNAAGVLGALSLFTGPIGFAGMVANAFYNNEVDGKIERVVADLGTASDEVQNLLIGNIPHNL